MKITTQDILSVLNEQAKPLVESFDVSDAVSKAATAELTKVFGKFGVNTKGAKLTKDGFGKFDVTPKNFLPNLFKKVELVTSAFLGTDKDGSVLTGLRVEYRWEVGSGGSNGETYGTYWFNETGKLVRFNAW